MTTASWRDKGEVEGLGRAEERKQRVKKGMEDRGERWVTGAKEGRNKRG